MRPHGWLVMSLSAALAAGACSSGATSGGGDAGGHDSGSSSGSSGGSSGSSSGTSSSSGSSSSSGGDAASGDTWANWAQGFFTKYCVECHAASDPKGLDFTMQSIVVSNKDTIRCGVCVTQDPSWGCGSFPPAKQFPISDMAGTNPKPSDAERDRVVAWIDAGCP